MINIGRASVKYCDETVPHAQFHQSIYDTSLSCMCHISIAVDMI